MIPLLSAHLPLKKEKTLFVCVCAQQLKYCFWKKPKQSALMVSKFSLALSQIFSHYFYDYFLVSIYYNA